MIKVESYEQIQLFTKQIRSLRKGAVTNFYWDANKHLYWIAAGTLSYEQSENCVLMLHQNNDFSNLYYIATDFDSVALMLNSLKAEDKLVADIVCKGDGKEELNAFKEMGFTLYKRLYRMNHVGQLAQIDWVKDKSVAYGTKDDALLVYQTLQRDFDPVCEQLPLLSEIEDFAERGQIWIIKDGKNVCGFLIAELTGMTWYLRYWYTSPDYRDLGIGSKLLRASLIDSIQSKRQLFWVIADNENAIKRYEHYGFTRENLNDFVMIKLK